MKRVLCALLSLLLVAGCLTVGAFATETENETEKVVTAYVKDGGNGDGLSEDTPVGYINNAIEVINDARKNDETITAGKIVLVGDVTPGKTLDATSWYLTSLDAYEIPITITSKCGDDGAPLYKLSLQLPEAKADKNHIRGLVIGGFTTFENITIDSNSGRCVIYENYKGLVIGEGVKVTRPLDNDGSAGTFISAGSQSANASIPSAAPGNSYIEIHSGEWNRVTLVPIYEGKYRMGNITVIADHCTFKKTGIDMATANWQAGEYIIDGDVNVLIGKDVTFTDIARVQIGLGSDVQSSLINGNVFVGVDAAYSSKTIGINFGNRVTFKDGRKLYVSDPGSKATKPTSDARYSATSVCLPTLAGHQVKSGSDETWSTRFLATVPTVEGLSKVGFEITPKVGDQTGTTKTVDADTVYASVVASGETVSATSLGNRYLYAVDIEGIPTSAAAVEFTVKPFVTDSNGTTVYGTTYTVTVNAPSN